jgi:hypothetical protein
MKGRYIIRALALLAVTMLVAVVAGAARGGTVEPRPLAGLTNDNSVYLAAEGEWHQVTPFQFQVGGLSQHAITWYDTQLPGDIGAPATNEQVAQVSADYKTTLEDLGVSASKPSEDAVPAVAVPASVKPVISTGVAAHKPIAGHPFVVNFHVTRSDNSEKLMTGTMISNPSVNGKVIYPHWERFDNGVASVLLTVPKTAKGKMLTVPLTIKLGSELTRQVETYQVG